MPMTNNFDTIESFAKHSNEIADFLNAYKTIQFFYDDCLSLVSFSCQSGITGAGYVDIELMVQGQNRYALEEITRLFRNYLHSASFSFESRNKEISMVHSKRIGLPDVSINIDLLIGHNNDNNT